MVLYIHKANSTGQGYQYCNIKYLKKGENKNVEGVNNNIGINNIIRGGSRDTCGNRIGKILF
jgi:hypothetical protein